MDNLMKKTKIGFLFSLYEATSGELIVTHSVNGNKMGPVLEEIAKTITKYQTQLGENNVVLKTVKARINENTIIVDPAKMDSMNTMLTMVTEHYGQKDSSIIVESSKPKTSVVENLRKILANPKKAAKLVEGAKKLQELDLPKLDIGDTLLVGKWKNRKAEIKGFETDDNGQPVAKTNKGDQKIFKPRIAKLMPEKPEN